MRANVCRRPEIGETVLPQRPASGAHHALLPSDVDVRTVPGARGHHHGRVHANGVTALGLTRTGQRTGQQGCQPHAKQKKSTCLI